MQKQSLGYLACPYSSPELLIRKKRFLAASWASAQLISQGTYVYSPLTHNVPLVQMGMGNGWEKWQDFDSLMLSRCNKLILLKMPGWDVSAGVSAELEYARQLGMPIEEFEAPDEQILDSLMNSDTIDGLIHKLKNFYAERQWDQFHAPKNLAMNIAVEVGELLEHFRWLTTDQSYELSEDTINEVNQEIGDVFNMLVYLSNKLGIDPLKAANDKIIKMGKRYPAHLCKGKALKYTAYENEK